MRTLLIHHEGAELEERVIMPWLASFSDLRGRVVVVEGSEARRRRIRREIRRIGFMRIFDVLAFRAYYRFALASDDRAWEAGVCDELAKTFPAVHARLPTLRTTDPNDDETYAFVAAQQPDLVLARCRMLLDQRLFEVPPLGTYVMHPGIVPEYRNSHGCFWALANRDLDRVGMTLLKIDSGVDTGPVYGFYTYDFDELSESHVRIQKRMVLENLDALREMFEAIAAGTADPIDVSNRKSAAWGQPWLTKYMSWKRKARR